MEDAALVAKRDAIGSRAGSSLGKRGEVFDGIRHGVAIQAKDDSTGILSIKLEVEVDFLGDGVDCRWDGRLSGVCVGRKSVNVDKRLFMGHGCGFVGGVGGMVTVGGVGIMGGVSTVGSMGIVGTVSGVGIVGGVSGPTKCIGLRVVSIAWDSWFFGNNWIFKNVFILRASFFDVREGRDAGIEVRHFGMFLAFLEAIEHGVEIEGTIDDITTVEVFVAGRWSGGSLNILGVAVDVAGLVAGRGCLISVRVVGLRAVGSLDFSSTSGFSV